MFPTRVFPTTVPSVLQPGAVDLVLRGYEIQIIRNFLLLLFKFIVTVQFVLWITSEPTIRLNLSCLARKEPLLYKIDSGTVLLPSHLDRFIYEKEEYILNNFKKIYTEPTIRTLDTVAGNT